MSQVSALQSEVSDPTALENEQPLSPDTSLCNAETWLMMYSYTRCGYQGRRKKNAGCT